MAGGGGTTDDGGRYAAQLQTPNSELQTAATNAADAVFYTNFYPSADRWRGTILQSFDHAPAAAESQPISATSPEALRHRPGVGSRAPTAKLLPQGRGEARATTEGASETVESSSWPVRELPVFLTEYGYGGLDKESRRSAEGRERQRAFFESVVWQIRELGIEGFCSCHISSTTYWSLAC